MQTEETKRDATSELVWLNMCMNRLESDLQRFENERQFSEKNIRGYAKIIVRLQNLMATRHDELKEQLRLLFKLGQGAGGRFLLGSRSYTEFFQNLRFLWALAHKSSDLMRGYRESLQLLADEKEKMKMQIRHFLEVRYRMQAEEVTLQKNKQKQIALLAQTAGQHDMHLLALKKWRKEAEVAGIRLPASLAGPGFVERKGTLKGPVDDTVAERYGWTIGEKNARLFRNGIVFRPSSDKFARFVARGTIAFSDWIQRVGYTVIVDQGDHFYTVYVVPKSPPVKRGQAVEDDQPLERLSEGDSLYFEVRHYTQSEDPMAWLDLKKP